MFSAKTKSSRCEYDKVLEDAMGNLDRSFHWLNLTQFLGALNDNLFKLLLIFFLIDISPESQAGSIAALGGALFVLPFLGLSAAAGRLADRFSKRQVVVAVKGLEVLAMLAGMAAFHWHSSLGLYAVLILMAAQSALFSPSKYGIVPELVKPHLLSRANARLEAFTYLAIILGTTLAALLPSLVKGDFVLAGAVCVVIALFGLLTSLPIKTTPVVGNHRNGSLWVIPEIVQALRFARQDRPLLSAILGLTGFTFVAAFFQLNLIPFGMESLHLSQEQSGALFLVSAVGIGLGSLLAGRLSGRTIEFGLVPVGAMGLSLSCWGLALISPNLKTVLPLLFVLGASAGMFLVPLNAFLQSRPPVERRGEVLAVSNTLSWLGVLFAALFLYLLNSVIRFDQPECWTAIAVIASLLAAATIYILKDFFLRFVVLLAMRLVYRVRVHGVEHVPTSGGALLVANHVSWIDALLLVATQQRRIRFLMDREIFHRNLLKPICRLMGVIPISAKDSPRQLLSALQMARQALDDGYLVCIFGEGAITRNGQLGGFKSGLERIVQNSDHQLIPTFIGGVWGSAFSYAEEKKHWWQKLSLPAPVDIYFAAPLPSSTKAGEIRQVVQVLSCDWYRQRRDLTSGLGRSFVKSARKNWLRLAVADTLGLKMTYGRLLTAALAFSQVFRKCSHAGEKVGLLLPPSVPAVVANLALSLSGRVPVNLNYTLSQDVLLCCVEQCDMKTIVSSSRLLERFPQLKSLPGLVEIEVLTKTIDVKTKIKAWLKAALLPPKMIGTDLFATGEERLATVLFSSGSTGRPKGVLLSDFNILANIEGIGSLVRTSREDNICGTLPFFHSFGLTGTLWLPLLRGFSAIYHSNPLDSRQVAKAVKEYRSTLLLATPTFLSHYVRKVDAEDFASLRLVVTGAEKLRNELAEVFRAKFNIQPMEGFGATELSPVAALNIPDKTVGGIHQVGMRPGSVGRPLPGVAVRVVDVDSWIDVSAGEQGLVLIKGPNVMQGYLGLENHTNAVLRDGWYVTGDLGRLDTDGFLYITDRLTRFSKIGGEMVPHLAIEDVLQQGLGLAEQVVAVCAVPDPSKGERLVVLYEEALGSVQRLWEILERSGLPNLWRPAKNSFLAVERLPLLGSGKLDLAGLRQMAQTNLQQG